MKNGDRGGVIRMIRGREKHQKDMQEGREKKGATEEGQKARKRIISKSKKLSK